MRVAPARDAEDRAAVFRLRHEGYRCCFPSPEDAAEEIDFAEGVTLYLARCASSGAPLGILRVATPPARPEAGRFADLGEAGAFAHPGLGGRRHRTLALPTGEAAALYAAAGYGLHRFFVTQHHPILET